MSDSPLKVVEEICYDCDGEGEIFSHTDEESCDCYKQCTTCKGKGMIKNEQATFEMQKAYEEYKVNKMINQDVPYGTDI